MFAGLFFSWSGDVILEFSQNNGNMFILGLGCFLLAHVMYFTVFLITEFFKIAGVAQIPEPFDYELLHHISGLLLLPELHLLQRKTIYYRLHI
jgi:hypothetical protein